MEDFIYCRECMYCEDEGGFGLFCPLFSAWTYDTCGCYEYEIEEQLAHVYDDEGV